LASAWWRPGRHQDRKKGRVEAVENGGPMDSGELQLKLQLKLLARAVKRDHDAK
jgi:hypothetical protein